MNENFCSDSERLVHVEQDIKEIKLMLSAIKRLISTDIIDAHYKEIIDEHRLYCSHCGSTIDYNKTQTKLECTWCHRPFEIKNFRQHVDCGDIIVR